MAAPFRIGLIGAGRWGQNYIRTIAGLEGVVLTRISTRNPEAASLAPHGCVVVAAWQDILDRRSVDGVIVASPPASHAQIARAAIEAGLPVLVEKPLSLDLAEAQALQGLTHARGGLVMVDHTHLFHPAFRALKQAVPRHGAIRAIRSAAGNLGPFRADAPVLWDWGPHDVAMCIDLLERSPVRVEAVILEQRSTPDGQGQIIELHLEFPGSVPVRTVIGNIMPKQRVFAVFLDEGALVYDDLAASKLVFVAGAGARHDVPRGGGRPLPIGSEPPLTCAVREFARAATELRANMRSLDLAVDVVRVLAKAQDYFQQAQCPIGR